MTQKIPYDCLLQAPWKNGGGSSTEIAVFPPNARFDDFDWRISLATIACSGAFSVFPGIDRTLCLVAGDGVVLEIDRRERFALHAGAPTIEFAGEAAVFATVGGGANPVSIDFNVMTRRSRCRHRFERVRAPQTLARCGGTTVLFLAEGGQIDLCGGGQQLVLGHFDTLLLGPGDAAEWVVAPAPGAIVLVVDIFDFLGEGGR
jgi:uncharacterized protein